MVSTLEWIKKEKFIAIARNIPAEDMAEVAKAVFAGGVTLLEVTFNQGKADTVEKTQHALSSIRKEMGRKMRLGVGTVLSTQQVRAAHEAGADFIISPNTNAEVIKEAKRLGMVSIPGAMTPTEIVFAWDGGADLIKIFPADDLGYHYFKNIMAPLGHIPMIATGGVSPETIPEFFSLGIAGVGAGITVIKPQLVQEKNFTEITRLARQHIEAVKRCAST